MFDSSSAIKYKKNSFNLWIKSNKECFPQYTISIILWFFINIFLAVHAKGSLWWWCEVGSLSSCPYDSKKSIVKFFKLDYFPSLTTQIIIAIIFLLILSKEKEKTMKINCYLRLLFVEAWSFIADYHLTWSFVIYKFIKVLTITTESNGLALIIFLSTPQWL